MYPEELRYNKEHEWVRVENGNARIGITYYAQDELGDVVYVELPQVGDHFEVGDPFATVESVKAVSDIYAPVGGKIVEVNERLNDEPELINSGPYEDGWIAVIEMDNPSDLDQLMDAQGYKEQIGQA